MHVKVPFLTVFVLTLLQVVVTAVLSYEEFNEILLVQPEKIVEIEITDFSNQVHSIQDPEQIQAILDYLNLFEYQRLVNDQTAYMPMNTMMVTMYDGEQSDFIIPYGDEVLISHKVYQLKNGPIDPNYLLKIAQ